MKAPTGNQARCTVCGELFSTDANFDRHRKGEHGVNRHCVDPASVGLVLVAGVWKLPPAKHRFWANAQARISDVKQKAVDQHRLR